MFVRYFPAVKWNKTIAVQENQIIGVYLTKMYRIPTKIR